MTKWHAPLDPDCPANREFIQALLSDEMTIAMGAPVDEIVEDFEKKHRAKCKRCQEYGAANMDIQ
jgi:hypothetical protein